MQDEVSFCMEIPSDGDSVDEVDFSVGSVMTVPPNKVNLLEDQ